MSGVWWSCLLHVIRLVDEPLEDFTQLTSTLSRHGVLITPHGPSMMSVLMMIPFAAVIELFPYHVDSALYPAMSALLAIGNYPIHSHNRTTIDVADEVGGVAGVARCR